jgi:peptidoglycan/xylan/chitin deacetylase (PgdA/CDA1 family)
MDRNLPILAYHKIDPRRELGLTSLSPRTFERQIRLLKHEGYTCISPQFLISHATDTTSVTKPVLITFDDGYEGIYHYAYPLLKKYGSNAIIFLTTGYIGRYNRWDSSPGPRFRHLDWAHIREMADAGIWFGSHGVNHTFLTRQSDSLARYELEASKKSLEDRLGLPVPFFSYPYGDYDDRVIDLVREAGYTAAFSLQPEFLRAGYTNGSRRTYALPRIAIYLLDGMSAFRAKIGSGRNGLLPYTQKLKNQLINRCAYASMLVGWLLGETASKKE